MKLAIELARVSTGLSALAASVGRRREPTQARGPNRGTCVLGRRWPHGAPRSALPHYLPDVRTGPLF